MKSRHENTLNVSILQKSTIFYNRFEHNRHNLSIDTCLGTLTETSSWGPPCVCGARHPPGYVGQEGARFAGCTR